MLASRKRTARADAACVLTAWAVIATGKHLFPFRTEKLSPFAPMVLGEQSPGRVGCRRITLARSPRGLRAFLLDNARVELRDADVLLRPFRADDAAAVAEACSDPDIQRFVPGLPFPYTIDDARAYISMCRRAARE